MNISELYKAKQLHLEDVEFKGCKFKVKIFTEKEANELADLGIHEQLGKLIYENDKNLEELGCVEDLKENMPVSHMKDLIKLIMDKNGVDMSIEEAKKN